MRFLCVQCNEALTFVEARGPDEGSLTAVFRCPACWRDIAMITNPHETHIVQSLHVQLGGRTVPPEPLEAIRGSLRHSRKLGDSEATRDEVTWTQEATERIERIPDFVRGMVVKTVEDYARERGLSEITGDVVGEAKGLWGETGKFHRP